MLSLLALIVVLYAVGGASLLEFWYHFMQVRIDYARWWAALIVSLAVGVGCLAPALYLTLRLH